MRILKIPVLYLILGFLWIFFSDHLVSLLFPSQETQVMIQTYKGWFFILLTTALLALLVKRDQDSLERANDRLGEMVSERTFELKEANRELQESLEILVRKERMAALGELVAGFSHEISTPIGNARMAISYLKDHDDQGGNRESATAMLKSADRSLNRASQIIRSFKTVSVERRSEECERFSVGLVVLDTLEVLSHRLENGHITVFPEVDENPRIYGNPGHLSQIVTNLIQNSIQHGFTEDQKDRKIFVSVRQTGSSVLLAYRDNGRGMDEEVKRKVFEPFFTTSRTSGATGIGLYVVFNLVSGDLKGSISVSNDSDPGAGFRIVLPMAEDVS